MGGHLDGAPRGSGRCGVARCGGPVPGRSHGPSVLSARYHGQPGTRSASLMRGWISSHTTTPHGPRDFAPARWYRVQIFDQQTVERLETRYGSGSRPVIAETIEALASKLGLPSAALVRTVTAYNAAVQDGSSIPLSRTANAPRALHRLRPTGLSAWTHRLLWRTGALRHHLHLRRRADDPSAEVLHSDGTPVPGLYAAGDHRWHFLPQLSERCGAHAGRRLRAYRWTSAAACALHV